MPALDGKACQRDEGSDSVSFSIFRIRQEQRWYGMSSDAVLPGADEGKSTAVWGRASQTAVGGESEIASVMLVTHIHTHAGR